MKVGSNPQTGRAASVVQEKAQTTPGGKFSEVLKEKKDRRDSASTEGLHADSALITEPTAALAAVTSPAPANIAVVDSDQTAASGTEALVASLVREITVQMPPGGAKSVDIQFDSRTLDGLHVRIQKTDSGLNVQLSTASEAVSKLLTSNTHALTSALEQRGYISPVITVQRPDSPAAFSSSDSGRSSRDRDGRNGKEQGGGGQKRR